MDKSLIISRIKKAKNFTSDTELANFLGINKSTLSNWSARNSIDFDLVFSKCEDISYDWLLRGDGNMRFETNDQDDNVQIVDEKSLDYFWDRYEKVVIENNKLKEEINAIKSGKRHIHGVDSYPNIQRAIDTEMMSGFAAEKTEKYEKK